MQCECRNAVHNKCTYRNSSHRLRSSLAGLGTGSAWMDCWNADALPLLLRHPLHLHPLNGLLPITGSCNREKKLHLHGCSEVQPGNYQGLVLWALSVCQSLWNFYWLHNNGINQRWVSYLPYFVWFLMFVSISDIHNTMAIWIWLIYMTVFVCGNSPLEAQSLVW